ncbi:hypothetical protein ACQCN2_08090 [Brevibacillus ginsengisoli]|uniref:hypothetical protein n=1 Tax=Brevibacillus ginsengisoli TaxID=363854 RepID=UPI003CFB25B6
MAYCIECGKSIEDGKVFCSEHENEEIASTQAADTASVGPALNQVSNYLNQWLPILKQIVLQPYTGLRSVGKLPNPFLGISLIVLGALLKAIILSSILDSFARKMGRMLGMGMMTMGDLSDVMENDFTNHIFFKVFLYDVVELLLFAVVSFAVLKFICKNHEISFTHACNGIGITQVYIIPGLLIGLLLIKISAIVGFPYLFGLFLFVPTVLHAYFRENGWIKPANVYAIPLIFFFTIFITAIFL